MRYWVTSKATLLSCSKAGFWRYPFSKISHENSNGRDLLSLKLKTNCSEQIFYTKVSPPFVFFGNLRKVFSTPKHHKLWKKIFLCGKGKILSMSNICFHEVHISRSDIFSVSSKEIFSVFNNMLKSIKKIYFRIFVHFSERTTFFTTKI